MHLQLLSPFAESSASPPTYPGGLFPGDAGWGDILFISIWGGGSLLLAAYFLYRSFFSG